MASQYVDQGITKEFHLDSNTTSYAERVSFGSTEMFTIRALAAISTVGATGLSTASSDLTTPSWARGIEIYAAVTAVTQGSSGDATITLAVQPKSPVSNDYITGSSWIAGYMAGSTTVFSGTTGNVYLAIHPGVTAVTGGLVPIWNTVMPQTFRVLTTLAGSSANWTYGLSGRFIP